MSWDNYGEVLAELQAYGLLVDGLEVGKLRRCKVEGDREKRGWYSLHELRLDDGGSVLVGSYGINRGADHGTQKIDLAAWLKGKKRDPLTDEQRAALKARIKEDQARAERERKAANAKAALRAQHAWTLMAREGESAYLKRKGVQGHGVRYSRDGREVIIPLLDTSGRIHGLQRIYPDKSRGRDKDFWPSGLAKQGHFFQIGPQPTSVLLIAEGYATAASLFEATGWPTFVAWDAGNLLPVAEAVAKRHKGVRVLVCADDDYLQKCRACGQPTLVEQPACAHCGKPHQASNAGVSMAAAAALAVGGSWVTPQFAADRAGKKITDFNDLHALEGLHQVRAQIEAKLRQLGWGQQPAPAPRPPEGEGEDCGDGALRNIETVEELQGRFSLVYELADTVFDAQECKLVPLASVRNICSSRMLFRNWMESANKRIVRVEEVGFDPAGQDQRIKCNLWAGWPAKPKAGDCDSLLELLWHLCSAEDDPAAVYQWTLKWLAYPLQHPGAKMKTCLIFHGPQGSGKNMFMEAYAGIYGGYARVIDQAAVEDKFNDWASRKLFMIADEVVARAELYHIKNKLKVLITGDTIRINPKNVGAYEERNHVNFCILSNEVMPAILERDDRRHLVVWTPPKMDPAFYERVKIETESGGVAALHHHLLNLPLGDFKPWTLPPMTRSKRELVDASMGSSERFLREWKARDIPLPLVPCRSEDLFDAYRYWCHRTGGRHPAINVFVAEACKLGKLKSARRRYLLNGVAKQSMVLAPEDFDEQVAGAELGEHIQNFAKSVTDWRRDSLQEVA